MTALISLALLACVFPERVGFGVGARYFCVDTPKLAGNVGGRVGSTVGRRVGLRVGGGVGRAVGRGVGVGTGAVVGQLNLGSGWSESRHTSCRIHE